MNITFFTRLFRFLSHPARTKRFEILLPLNYNDGTLIEPEKFDQTATRFQQIDIWITAHQIEIIWRRVAEKVKFELM